jgi:hypothetical protein
MVTEIERAILTAFARRTDGFGTREVTAAIDPDLWPCRKGSRWKRGATSVLHGMETRGLLRMQIEKRTIFCPRRFWYVTPAGLRHVNKGNPTQ